MKVKDLIRHFKLRQAAGEKGLDRDVRNGYCGDLLSDVMAGAPDGCVWMTIQGHPNIVAVAVLRDMAAIVLCGAQELEEKTRQAAEREGMPVLLWPGSAYELAGRLYELGIGRP